MSLFDRVGRGLFVALAVGLGWGIRGDFGHLVGAMYPGAALAMALAYVSGQRSLFLWMPVLAALSAAAVGAGGTMSYGILHGYAQSDTLVNYGYGFLTLFLQGSAWGTFAGGMIGLVLERRPLRTAEWLGYAGTILFAGWVTSFLVVDVLGFPINPPRNNGSIAYMGAALGQIAWLWWAGRSTGLRGATLGYVGFGLGMAAGRLLGNLANAMQQPYGFTINHWNVMETSCGAIGGFVVAFGMLGRAYPGPPQGEGEGDEDEARNVTLASFYGVVYTLGLIPLWHRLNRINNPEAKIAEWAASLKGYGYADPQGLARLTLWLIDGVCAFGLVGAAVWWVVYLRRAHKAAGLPVLWLSLTMLLYQNLNALFFFYPHEPGKVNLHVVFWALYVLMAVYVGVRPCPSPGVEEFEGGADGRFPLAAWAAFAAAGLAAVVWLAGSVNGEATMKAANTRWPLWSWKDGPFPGRAPSPPPSPSPSPPPK